MNPPHLAIVRQKCQIYDTLLRPVTKQQQQNTGGIGANKKRDKQKWGKRCSRSPSNGSYAVKYLFYFGFNSSLFRKEVKKKKKGKKKNNMAPAAISHVKISILLRFWRKEWNSILNKGFEFSTNRQCESCVGIIKEQMWEAQVKIQQWRFWKGKVCCVTSSHWKKLNCDPHLNGITRTDKFWNKQKITFSTHLEENENKQKPCTLNEKESDT